MMEAMVQAALLEVQAMMEAVMELQHSFGVAP
jgi:hypothetical protein